MSYAPEQSMRSASPEGHCPLLQGSYIPNYTACAVSRDSCRPISPKAETELWGCMSPFCFRPAGYRTYHRILRPLRPGFSGTCPQLQRQTGVDCSARGSKGGSVWMIQRVLRELFELVRQKVGDDLTRSPHLPPAGTLSLSGMT